jgi:molybdopterin-containing oxidoreductase family iron-sulfur binding subunit
MKHAHHEVWIGADDLNQDPELLKAAAQEFVGQPLAEQLENAQGLDQVKANRRDFLKVMGFSVSAAAIAASCEIPTRRAIPYVNKPDSIVPGVANYYASSFVQGGDYCAVLVKTREGRPIKVEGNDLSKVTRGGTNARTQASVLSLYDTNRIQTAGKVKDGNVDALDWEKLDSEVGAKLGSNVRIVTNTVLSPTTRALLADFVTKRPGSKVVTYDPVSSTGILLANEKSFGMKVIPNYAFDKAQTIVSFNADFLGTWISPIEFAAQYATNRGNINADRPRLSHHVQVEAGMSMTGSNADNRVLVKPSEQGAAIAALYNAVAGAQGASTVAAPKLNDKAAKALSKLGAKLAAAAPGTSLIVSGSNNVGEQVLVNAINTLLGNYGANIEFGEYSLQRQGDDREVQALINDMKSGAVSSVIFMGGANPVFELPNGAAFATAMAKVPVRISMSSLLDETTLVCNYAAPAHHYLESWGDAEPKRGHYSLIQPTIAPVFKTRQAETSLMIWGGFESSYQDYLKNWWQTNVFPSSSYTSFQAFWDNALHDGVVTLGRTASTPGFVGNVQEAASTITKPASSEWELDIYERITVGGGQYANNPWLQEMPDPVDRTVWGNTLHIPIEWDGINDFTAALGLKDGDLVKLNVNGKDIEATIVRQFGQMPGTASIALGYGRESAGLVGTGVGINVQNLIGQSADGLSQYIATQVKMGGKAGKDSTFASVQYHHTMGVTGMGKEEGKEINVDEKALGYKGYQGTLTRRSIVRQAHIKDAASFLKDLKKEREGFQELNARSIYKGHTDEYTRGHHWNMYVDLNACIGCGACTVACMSENNVPVVGKKEVHRHHEMTWLRIDRYFYGDVENPNTVYQPMMCQHCDNAPCENVCPVNATNHSGEGLNQMTYNRCIGTRYCANNCPYKVRRFNWLDYTTADIFPWNERSLNGEKDMPWGSDNLTRMVLNPDVTVRSRGVIEKCSFCVQRIQEGKLTAKRETRQLRDGDIKTACQTACPTGAIVFGDANNKESMVSKRIASPINYLVLEDINVAPNVVYSAKFHNRDKELS